jgi:hypothetical protein
MVIIILLDERWKLPAVFFSQLLGYSDWKEEVR